MKCGVDIVSISRIRKLVERKNENSLLRIWTKNELEDCKKKDTTYNLESLAGKFAAKEAVSKALGTGFGKKGVNALEIEIITDEMGAPNVNLYGSTKQYFINSNYQSVSISISHDLDTAIAMCVLS